MIRVEVMLEFSSDTTSVEQHRASKKHLEVSTEKPAGGKDPVLPAVGRVTHWLYGDEQAGKVVGRGGKEQKKKRRGKRGARVM